MIKELGGTKVQIGNVVIDFYNVGQVKNLKDQVERGDVKITLEENKEVKAIIEDAKDGVLKDKNKKAAKKFTFEG